MLMTSVLIDVLLSKIKGVCADTRHVRLFACVNTDVCHPPHRQSHRHGSTGALDGQTDLDPTVVANVTFEG